MQLREFAQCFASMPQSDQDVIVMIAVDGMSYADVADILEVPVGTVKSRLSRARARLRGSYSSQQGRPEQP